MRKVSDIVAIRLPPGDDSENVKLSDIHKLMMNQNRIPILDSAEHVTHILHRSTLGEYATVKGIDIDNLTDTISDLMTEKKYADLATTFAFVSEDATVSQARTAIEALTNCNDVFVTKGGQRTEAVLGWMTNTRLARTI